MSCPYSPEDLSAYVDGETGPSARRQIRDHLRACIECRQTVADLARVSQTLRGLPPAEPHQPAAWSAKQFSGPEARPIHCAVVLPEGSAFIDGELPADDVPPVIAHLAQCDACYGAYREIEGVADALALTSPVPVPRGLEERILAAVEADRHSVLGHLFRHVTEAAGPAARVAVRLAAAAAVVALVGFGVYHGTAPAPGVGDTGSAVAVVPSVEVAEPAETEPQVSPSVAVAEADPIPRPPTPVTSEPTVGAPGGTEEAPGEPGEPPVAGPRPGLSETVPRAPTVVAPQGPPVDTVPVVVPSVPEGAVAWPVVASARGPQTGGRVGLPRPPAEALGPTGIPKSAPPDDKLLVSAPEADAGEVRVADSGAAVPIASPEPQINWSSPRANPKAATLPAARLDVRSLRALERDANAGLRSEGRSRAPSFAIHP